MGEDGFTGVPMFDNFIIDTNKIYLNTDSSNTTNKLYINTDNSNTWSTYTTASVGTSGNKLSNFTQLLFDIIIDTLPQEKRSKGKWKREIDADGEERYCCSKCGRGEYCVDPYEWIACPWCDATMDGIEVDEEGAEE